MKVLIVGGGGREHALAWKIARSPLVTELFAAPGNPGIAEVATCVDIAATDVDRLLAFARERTIDLTIVGPEAPLVAGIADDFARYGLPLFGPSARAASIEGSKIYAKQLMRRHNIPTAAFKTFDAYEAALHYVRTQDPPLVVKADGLAAGKGVFVCSTQDEALDAVRQIMRDRAFGDAGERVLIEDCLVGSEASMLAITDGRTIAPLETCQDHKAIGEGDTGPNTGGMGAYSPAPMVSPTIYARIEREILLPTVHALNVDERPYRGLLYAGLMLTEGGPRVLEYNCRFGDPEAQPLLMRLKSDLLPVLLATVQGRLDRCELDWDLRPTVCVVLVSEGYPGPYETGRPIEGLAQLETGPDLQVFHAGTARRKDGTLVTAGGRVLGVTARADTLEAAREAAYATADRIHFQGKRLRRDIGAKGVAWASPGY